ncbi:MAG: PmoA family protein [Balneolaceae bacterium]
MSFQKFSCLIVITALMVAALQAASLAQQPSYSVTVSAGEFDRAGTIVTFYFSEAMEPGVYRMKSESGEEVDVQVDEKNRGRFILDRLQAGASRTYRVSAGPVSADPAVSKRMDSNTLSFLSDGREVLSYYHSDNEPPAELDERYKRSGYIHPVYSPNGVLLTNHLNPDVHPHHSGIWSAWTNTRFQGRTPDFWNIHLNSGRVEGADSLDVAWEGPVHGGFRARHHFIDLSSSAPVVALNEEWDVSVYRSPENGEYHLFDLVVTQSANTAQPLVLPEYRYGGVGFRGHVDWDDPDNVFFLTSEGLGRDGHATRARWCHIGGYSEGELAGIAILGHPENFRHPQPMRIHPEEPFFNYAPTQLGDMVIEPGSPYVVRYRYVTYDGEPDPDELDRLWNDYAYPPGVTVKTVD